MNQPSAAEALEQARRELLDLGINHNSLLNFRQSSRVGVEIIGERTADVFRILVTDQKSMGFLAAKRKKNAKASQGDNAESEAITDDDDDAVALDDLDLPNGEDAYTDRFLQTRYKRESLEARLRITAEEAATHIEEQGVNILYLALGFLHWRDPNGEERRAPLILVPAMVERATVTSKYAVSWNKDDLGSNLSLQEKLRSDFAIELAALDDQDPIDPIAYIDHVRTKVAHLDGWEVASDEMALGFFSFGKFLMYRDLDASLWPEDNKPFDHPVLDGILVSGFADGGPVLDADGKLDHVHRPGVTTEVMDADSSQALVLEEAYRGRHLVIQGPPGTGKSQTITNLIAAAVVAGKKVLFVAEKMAALEVVKRRMDNIGIGDCALELHSHKSSKKQVLTELKRVLELGEPLLGDLGQSAVELAQTRDRLNAYCQAISAPVGTSGKTPYQLMGEMLAIDRDGAVPRLPFAPLASWNADTFNERLTVVDELQRVIAGLGIPRQHPWFGVTRATFLPSEVENLRHHLLEARESIAVLQTVSTELATLIGLTPPVDMESVERLSRSAEILLRMPAQTAAVAFANHAWVEKADDFRTLITQGIRYQDLHTQFEAQIIPEAWAQNLLKTRQALKVHGAKLLRILSGNYRQARAQLIGLCVNAPPTALSARLALVDGIMESQRLTALVTAAEHWARPLAGSLWSGTQTTWKPLQAIADWLVEAHRAADTGSVDPGLLQRVGGGSLPVQLATQRATVDTAAQRTRTALATLTRELGWSPVTSARATTAAAGAATGQSPQTMEPASIAALDTQPLVALAHQVATWLEQLPTLSAYLGYVRLANRCTECGLGHVIPWAQQWELAGTRLTAILRRSWFAGWLDQAHRERPELSQFDQVNHEEVVARFRRAEEVTFAYNRARVALHHWQGLPGGGGGVGQLGILRRQTELKTRHWPIRQLLAHAPQAVQAVKPVFMMSPMSVATFLAPEGPRFDLVVFDEASQVRPVDAFGALMRGTQAVVVGDSKQMPPSSFFDRVMVSDSIDEDDLVQLQSTADVESVLGLMKARGVPERMLRWHYRSRHPSLIAVSNHDFYENRLIVSPSPDHGETPDGAGLSLRHLPNTSYDRGGTRTNVGEAQAVAEAVMAHAKTRTTRTLGVVAFSVAQKHAIEDALAKLRKADPTTEGFFTAHPNEPFFCKNLENVQGDERDVIFISIGYGKTTEGYLAMQFGPLSGPGGERRLNVLISRARYRCEVFTNLLAEDIVIERTQAVGVRSLRNFLQFAQTRRLGHLDVADDRFDSPFEEEVVYALRRLGHTVHTQVGSAGFRVDLAVVDPKHPGRYLLGIECDGATYHQQAWARDRDRLREDVLRGMGWNIHRIWSTSWFSNPTAQLREVITAIERAAAVPTGTTSRATPAVPASIHATSEVRGAAGIHSSAPTQEAATIAPRPALPTPAIAAATAHSAPNTQIPGEIARDHRKTRSTTTLVSPYRIAQEVFATSGELRDANPASIAQVLARIVAVESPVHIEDLHRRFLVAAGANRTGSRIQLAIDSGLGHAVTKRTIIRRGNFCWNPEKERVRPRYRGTDHPGKRFDYVAPEEIAEAVVLAVRESYGLHLGDIPKATSKLLGFQGLPDEAHQTIEQLVHQLIREGRIVQAGTHVRCL